MRSDRSLRLRLRPRTCNPKEPRVRILLPDDMEINCVVRGLGAPLLLVHGFPLDHRMWRSQIDTLSSRFQVIAPDLRGFGASDATTERVLSMRQFANDLDIILQRVGAAEPVIYCGLSMGGYIAWEMLRHHPSCIGQLILCDTRAAADSQQAARGRRMLAERVLIEGTGSLAEMMLPNLLCDHTLEHREKIVSGLSRMINETSPLTVAAAGRGMAERTDATRLLARIRQRTLLIVGRHDQISTESEMRGMSESVDDARLEVIEDAGHMAPLENPEAVNEAILTFLGH